MANLDEMIEATEIMVGKLNRYSWEDTIKMEFRAISYRSFATTVSQLNISGFSGERLKGFEVLYFI